MKGFLSLALAMVFVLLLAGEQMGVMSPTDGATTSASPEPFATSPSANRRSDGGGAFTGDALTLGRDATGQFHVEARVNGIPTRFLVDTGADSVALTVNDARAAGIPFDPDTFQPILRTASGEGWGTLARVDSVELGQAELRNIEVVVVRDLDVSLLGQSVLARMGRVEMQGDRMVIESR